jgi:hypothetical protein
VLPGFGDVSELGAVAVIVAQDRMPGWGAADRALERPGASPAQWVAIVVKAQIVVVLTRPSARSAQVPALAAQGTYGRCSPQRLLLQPFIDEAQSLYMRIRFATAAGAAWLVGLGGAGRALVGYRVRLGARILKHCRISLSGSAIAPGLCLQPPGPCLLGIVCWIASIGTPGFRAVRVLERVCVVAAPWPQFGRSYR